MNLFFITSSIHLHRFMRLDRLDPGSRDVLPFPDGPKFSLVSVRPAAKVLEGSVVTLSCSSNANPAADHIWYIGNQVIFSLFWILSTFVQRIVGTTAAGLRIFMERKILRLSLWMFNVSV